MFCAKENDDITNSIYQKINNNGKTVATEELSKLVEKGLLKQIGTKPSFRKFHLNF